MNVKGEPQEIRKFLNYFVFDDEEDVKEGKYLARTFIEQKKESFLKENKEEIDKGELNIVSWCAWSCWSCWFEGYPNGKELITMEEVLKECKVKIEVDSEETGFEFEEHIDNLDEELNYSSEDMKEYECECGHTESIPSTYDLSDYECCECGKFDKWKETKE
jgi:hypothetical protein